MNEYSINSYDGTTIQFSGELIGSSESAVEFRDGLQRKFCLKTYSSGKGFVAQIDFETEAESERPGTIVEVVDSVNDVQNFFFVFEAHEVLPGSKGLNRDQLNERSRLVNKLNAVYEKLSYTMLDQVESFAAELAEVDASVELKK